MYFGVLSFQDHEPQRYERAEKSRDSMEVPGDQGSPPRNSGDPRRTMGATGCSEESWEVYGDLGVVLRNRGNTTVNSDRGA